jgi:Saxitoxin biosynthesis operon protein SxtJ
MKKDTSKSAVLVISTGFLILYLIFSWRWAVITSLVVGIAGILSDSLSKMIEEWWMKLAHVLGIIVSSILLGIVFYLLLFPISLISKIFTRDTLMRSNKYPTYFIPIDKEADKVSFEKMW